MENSDKRPFYVRNSSIFSDPLNVYDIPLFTRLLKNAGARVVWTENLLDSKNQPKVVCFFGISPKIAKKALETVPIFKKWVICIDIIDW